MRGLDLGCQVKDVDKNERKAYESRFLDWNEKPITWDLRKFLGSFLIYKCPTPMFIYKIKIVLVVSNN